MNTRAVKLLQAASEMTGGDEALAERLGVEAALLRRLMSGKYELPETVLLKTVDIILANHESQPSLPGRTHAPPAPETAPDG